ncbi:nSTAND1 domain-containing NTPase [Shewanella donghaensis]|uniref:nSTAND1 domain-containing NTPase n=1 Tax=Shewanella donghaensis TaxID=238836 RepID=UPI001182571A|nr:winged helix-turn-helix domain-containing protein [Shewanella donghaensis]
MNKDIFFFGDWQVDPNSNTLRHGKKTKQLEPKAMDVLLLLCQHNGEVISSDDIVTQCWPEADIGDNPLHKIINQLRRALGDKATDPSYIETIRKRGYRTLAAVNFPIGHETIAEAQTWQSGSPFPGLQAYSANYAEVFFGRSKQINTLLERISQQVKFGRGFCLLLGPSGSGKSSIINAGVMPNLMATAGYNGVNVAAYGSLDFADVAKTQLFTELASTMLDWEINDIPVFDGDSTESLSHRLIAELQSVIDQCQQAIQTNIKNHTHFALFVDRLEVLLSSPIFSSDQRHAFVDILEKLAKSGAVIVISACRNEFYPLLVGYPSLMSGKGKGAHFDLAPPTRTELLQMIRLPAIAANLTWSIDPETAMPLDEILCTEAASNPDALPMLQYMLQALYINRSKDNQLLFTVYQQLGGIEGAIGKNAEEAIAELTELQKICLPQVLSLLVTLREDETSVTSRTARWSHLHTKEQRTLTQAMVNSRLFVSHLQNDIPCFSIAHEALLRRWPRATAWIAEHNDSLRIKSRLHHLSNRWLAENKHHAYLLAEGKPLKEAQSLKQNPLFSQDLEPQELALIAASSKYEKVKRWQKTFIISLLCVLTLTSILTSVKSFEAEKMAQDKRIAAENLLGFMVGDFADKMRGIGRMDLLDGISNKALEYFSDASSPSDDSLSVAARFQHAQTLEAIGEVAYSRGKVDEAKAALLSSRTKLLALLGEQPQDLDILKTLGANAFWLGQLDYDLSDWAASKVWFEQYLSYSQQMYDLAPENTEALMELSYAHNTFGSVSLKQQHFTQAKHHFELSLQLKNIALAQDPSNQQLLADIADTRSWLASAVVSQGDIHTAIKLHQQLQHDLLSNDTELDAYGLDRLFSSYQIHTDLLIFQGRRQQAFELALLAFEAVSSALQQDPQNQQWQIYRYYTMFKLFELSSADNRQLIPFNSDTLTETLRADKQIQQSTKHSFVWANYYLAAAKHFYRGQQFDRSQQSSQQAISLFSDMSAKQPNNVSYIAMLSSSQMLHYAAAKALNAAHSDTTACQQTKARLAPLLSANKDPKIIVPYAAALQCLGELDAHQPLIALLGNGGISITNH